MGVRKYRKLYSYVALTLAFAVFYYWVEQLKDLQVMSDPIAAADTIPAHIPTIYYGIVVDSLQIHEGTIRRNQNLADMLKPFHVDYEKVHRAATQSKDIFDVRKMVVRKNYSILYKGDSIKKATHFIYRPNSLEYVVIDFQDSVEVYKKRKPIELVEKELIGSIYTSLYVDMLADGGNTELVNKLVDIFAWQVDFFGIRKGDLYKIIYEQQVVDGEVVGIEKIKAAYFEHLGDQYYAVRFDQGSGVDFFDEKGNSLRREFLKAPLSFTRISSRYTGRRYHPVQKRYKAHRGTDYAAPRGTPIRAVGDGKIIAAKYHRYNGNFVKIQHNGNIATQYLHMSKIASGIRYGKKVKKGQTIGFVGSTGLANGPHLCYRFWKNGRQVDALRVNLPPSKPILKENQAVFDSIQSVLVKRLDMIQPAHQSENLQAGIVESIPENRS